MPLQVRMPLCDFQPPKEKLSDLSIERTDIKGEQSIQCVSSENAFGSAKSPSDHL